MDSPLLKLTERDDKTKALKNLLLELKKGDKAEDSIIAQRSGSFIVAVFSTAITIAGFSVMPPVIGGALIGACVASAGGTITALCSEFLHRKTSNKELLAVLTSKEVKQWIKLWELSSDTELFLTALEYACQGELIEINGREIFRHDDGKHPFDIAHSWILAELHVDADEPEQKALAPTAVDHKPVDDDSSPPKAREESPPERQAKDAGEVTPNLPPVNLFDFSRLRTEPDKFAHLRVIGGTGIGKTTFVDWLLDVLGGERFVITPKKKSWNWVGLNVCGLWFDYETIRAKLQWIHAEMYRRYPLMEAGETFELTNFVVDEWRLINTNVKAIKERDPETKQSLEVAPSAKAMMKDIITVAREAMLRLIALAQGENVASWGFEGESDLEECFTDIRLGEFAIDYAKSLRNQCRKDSDDYEYWTAVLNELERQSKQRTREGKSIPCCMVGKHPARVPDLTDWKRDVADINLEENDPRFLSVTEPSAPPSSEATQRERKVPPSEAEESRKPDGISVEAFSARITSALAEASGEADQTLPPLFDGLDRDGKLLMLRLLLAKRLGKEKTILLAWGLKSGGRSHDKYRMASELIDSMTRNLSELGFDEKNNWGIEP